MKGQNTITLEELNLSKTLFERIPLCISWKDTTFQYQYGNAWHLRIMGLDSTEAVAGKTDFDFFSKISSERIRKNDEQILHLGRPEIFEETYITQKGNYVLLTQKIPVIKANRIIGIMAIAFDITDKKEFFWNNISEKKDAEPSLDDILDNLPGNIFWKNKKGVFLGCNKAQALSAGFSKKSDLIGKTDYELPRQADIKRVRESDLYVIENKKVLTSEESTQLPGSHEVSTSLLKKVPLFNDTGEVIGILGISFDISDRKKLEENLRLAKEAAEAANQAKSEFLDNIRHDIRTPLSGIIGFAETLQSEATERHIKEYAENLTISSHALRDFLDEILEAVRVSSGEIPILKRKFSLSKTFERVMNLCRAKAKEKQLKLLFSIDSKLPRFVIGDKIRLYRIVLELIGNALNFTDKGQISLAVELAKQKDNQLIIRITVEDTGMGIPKDKQQEIYLQFKRLTPSYQGIYKGAGLGLYIVKKFIDDLGGEIYVKSELHKGSCFTCLIPLQIPLLDDESDVEDNEDLFIEKPYLQPLPVSEDKVEDVSIAKNNTTILVVEDGVMAQRAAKAVLSMLHCTVDIAADGEEAIALYQKKNYDLIFMDIGLGTGMDGYEVTHHIRRHKKESKHIPIIALTAHAGDENKKRCLAAGMDAVLTKPLTLVQAKDILAHFISSCTIESKKNGFESIPEIETEFF